MKIWQVNQQLENGKYIIEKYLGGGGFGVTWKAREQRTGKIVAIKTLNHTQQGKPDFKQRQKKFVNEALRLARFSHPNIVQVYEVIEEDGLWGMVMEYVDGQDLANYLITKGIFSEVEALGVIQQVGNALSYMHKQNYLHRDIKPANIILRRDNKTPVIIDFGLAREFTPGKIQSLTNELTEGFAPIEQYQKQGEPGCYTDVYALAVTLYVLLTNQVVPPAPFREQFNISVVEPKQHNHKISAGTNKAIIKGMALERKERPQSVQEWLDSLIPNKAVSPEVKLISAVGMDYTRLRDLLAAKRWKEADEETAKAMLKVAGKEEKSWLYIEEIDKFPCEDLRTIDQLWIKYSDGRFGFSVQKRIYQSLGGTRDYNEQVWEAFGDRVGWRVNNKWLYYNDLTFSRDSHTPEGHLPSCGGVFVGGCEWVWGGGGFWVGWSLLSRRDL